MLIAAAILLLVDAVFSVIVWPPFLRRVSRDPRARGADGRPTRFLQVHRVIIGVAMVLAAASAVVGVIALVVALA